VIPEQEIENNTSNGLVTVTYDLNFVQSKEFSPKELMKFGRSKSENPCLEHANSLAAEIFPLKSLEFFFTWYDNGSMDFVCRSLQLVNELRLRHI
jgi:hypothetical protein